MIFQFLNGTLPDPKGRYIEEILNFNDEELELCHDYIQVLFPLKDESVFNPNAPRLNDLEVSFIKGDELAIKNFISAIKMMVKFYNRTDHWATSYNHNLMRITRIIKSTSIIIDSKRSIDVHDNIMRRCYDLNFYPCKDTLEYWKYAIESIDPPDKIPTRKNSIIARTIRAPIWWDSHSGYC